MQNIYRLIADNTNLKKTFKDKFKLSSHSNNKDFESETIQPGLNPKVKKKQALLFLRLLGLLLNQVNLQIGFLADRLHNKKDKLTKQVLIRDKNQVP